MTISRAATGRAAALSASACFRLRSRIDAEAYTIVGVVGAVKQADLTDDEAQGAVYFPCGHRPDRDLFVVTRTSLPPDSFASTLQSVVRTIDPECRSTTSGRCKPASPTASSPPLPGPPGRSLLRSRRAAHRHRHLRVLSYAVAQRRREIALRMALGARPGQIRAQFLALTLRLLAAGTVLGIFGAWLTGQAMQAVLFHVPAFPVAILAGRRLVAAVSLAACLLPSHRAARISPMEALSDQ